jgi:hypothetical protein
VISRASVCVSTASLRSIILPRTAPLLNSGWGRQPSNGDLEVFLQACLIFLAHRLFWLRASCLGQRHRADWGIAARATTIAPAVTIAMAAIFKLCDGLRL